MSSRPPDSPDKGAETLDFPSRDPGSATTAQQPLELLAGRYRLGARLGQGGFGSVWAAQDRGTGDSVAVKLLSVASDHDRRRVRRELTALRWLRLPGCVRMLDEGEHLDQVFIVMERLAGSPFPGRKAPLSWAALEPILVQLLETLSRVHAAGVVHRDLKPGNVLVDQHALPVVLDFGISRGRAVGGGEVAGFEGTLRYAAPEQLRGQPADPRTDLFALGLMAHEALTTRVPHASQDARQFLARRLSEPVPSLVTELDLPPSATALLDALLALDPDQRPDSALDALARLGARPGRGLTRTEVSALPTRAAPGPDPLRPLFRGPDHFLHLREDGAAELFARTGGDPDRIAAELGAWVRGGLAHTADGLVVIDRLALEQLAGGLRLQAAAALPEALGASPRRLLRWLWLAWPDSREQTLAELFPGDFREALDTLLRAGLAWRLDDGRIGAGALLVPEEAGDAAVHAALAASLPGTSEGRARHLQSAGVPPRQVLEVVEQVAMQVLAEGRQGGALAWLERALALARELQDHQAEGRLLMRWVDVAIGQEAVAPLERALYELGRSELGEDEVEPLVRLVQGWATALRGEGERALRLLGEVGPLKDERLELCRRAATVRAAASLGVEAEEAQLLALDGWALGHPLRQAKVAGWRGNLRYRQGRHLEAAELHSEAATGKALLHERLSSQCNAAFAWVEAQQEEQALALADRVVAHARTGRATTYEACGVWVGRTCTYRLAHTLVTEPAMVDAAAAVVGYLEGAFAFTDAAAAWRAGELPLAVRWARRAAASYARAEQHPQAALAVALAMLAGEEPAQQVPQDVLQAALADTGTLGAQALAMLAMLPAAPPAWAEEARQRGQRHQRLDPSRRMEVLSLEEIRTLRLQR